MVQEQKKQISKIKIVADIVVLSLSLLLLACYISTYFASFVHLLELLSNFIIQYMIGALILGLIALALKKRLNAIVMLAVALICFIESRLVLNKPWQFSPPKEESTLTIASYNQHVLNENFNDMAEWFKTNGNDLDVAIIIEATTKTKRLANRVREIFPHQMTKQTIHPRQKPISYFILSKHKINGHEKIQLNLDAKRRKNYFAKFEIKPDNAKFPYTIYVVHTHSPVHEESAILRNKELRQIAEHLQNNHNKNIIAIGDFNITPYSQHFGTFKKISGLNFQSYGLLLNPSWPAQFKFPFLQIPIDHVFYSDTLVQQNKETGPSIHSDHKVLIAQFSEKE